MPKKPAMCIFKHYYCTIQVAEDEISGGIDSKGQLYPAHFKSSTSIGMHWAANFSFGSMQRPVLNPCSVPCVSMHGRCFPAWNMTPGLWSKFAHTSDPGIRCAHY